MLASHPSTRLGRLVDTQVTQAILSFWHHLVSPLQVPEEILTLCEEYIPGDPAEFFFDRNPENFPSILEMYR